MNNASSSANSVGVHYELPGPPGASVTNMLGIYRDGSFSHVAFPPLDGGISKGSKVLSLGSKIYLLRGDSGLGEPDFANPQDSGEFDLTSEPDLVGDPGLANPEDGESGESDLISQPGRADEPGPPIPNLFVFDLEETGGWKQCARMSTPRTNFGACALHGKIYVFGGWICNEPLKLCEVYDAESDTWSSMPDMLQARTRPEVTILEDRFLVYGGEHYWLEDPDFNPDLFDLDDVDHIDDAPDTVLDFNTERNDWSLINADGQRGNPFIYPVFVLNGCFHRITIHGIYRYDHTVTCSWTTLHTISSVRNGPSVFSTLHLDRTFCYNVIMIGGELFTVMDDLRTSTIHLVKTTQFGGPLEDIGLEIVHSFHGELPHYCTDIFPLHL